MELPLPSALVERLGGRLLGAVAATRLAEHTEGTCALFDRGARSTRLAAEIDRAEGHVCSSEAGSCRNWPCGRERLP
eukprot:2454536-Pleurochrysis_carterae.AAC.2